jgi:hypothetical protein
VFSLREDGNAGAVAAQNHRTHIDGDGAGARAIDCRVEHIVGRVVAQNHMHVLGSKAVRDHEARARTVAEVGGELADHHRGINTGAGPIGQDAVTRNHIERLTGLTQTVTRNQIGQAGKAGPRRGVGSRNPRRGVGRRTVVDAVRASGARLDRDERAVLDLPGSIGIRGPSRCARSINGVDTVLRCRSLRRQQDAVSGSESQTIVLPLAYAEASVALVVATARTGAFHTIPCTSRST